MTTPILNPVHLDSESGGRDATVKTVERVVRLLKQLAAVGEEGARLTDLARDLGLTKPTAHRLLGALAQAGMVRHESHTRRYWLGELSTTLGQLSARITVSNEARQSLVRLAAVTHDTVYVSVQEGAAAVCVGGEMGDFPIRTLTLAVGDRRPLGVGAGSMALFAFLPDAEIEATLARNAGWLANYPHFTPDSLREQVRLTRVRGYALNQDQVISGMSSIGVPAICCQGARPVGAFSVAAITERIIGPREAQLVALLRAAADDLSSAFCRDGPRSVARGSAS